MRVGGIYFIVQAIIGQPAISPPVPHAVLGNVPGGQDQQMLNLRLT